MAANSNNSSSHTTSNSTSNSPSNLMTSQKVRQTFIDYFKMQGHQDVYSSSLIPENDPTLLFTNAGMNQFKNCFLGLEHRDYVRAVSVQKCVRAGGKHNDLDNVGFTARHHTFFEMLGNFSFGDYFKKDAIHYAWELLTKHYGIPKDKLYITVHLSDDEAADIWHKQEGVPKDRIFRLDQDNFWRMGDTGPCGPSTEIFYDHGEKAGFEKDPFKGIVKGEDRFVEIWNLVFMQYFEKSPGELIPLPKPSVDTGSGVERVTAALQGKLSNYDTDLFFPVISRIAQLSQKEHLLPIIEKLNAEGVHSKVDQAVREEIAAMRVMADHLRSTSHLLADGALPSNEGRGYVLRRILRRAIRFNQKISGGEAFLHKLAEQYIQMMAPVYSELSQRKEHIISTIRDEQDRFLQTLGTGTEILNQALDKLATHQQKELPGEVVFKLYDTFGFPVDLTRLMAAEKGFAVNETNFEKAMLEAREKAKSSWKGKGIESDQAHLVSLAQTVVDQKKQTQFVGYENLNFNSQVVALSNGTKIVEQLQVGDKGLLILEQTPFYAESGGQAGDHGFIRSLTGSIPTSKNTTSTSDLEIKVLDCTKNLDVFIHQIEVVKGTVKTNDKVQCLVPRQLRRRTAANHSATHLLHAALRQVLGTHVTQAGQMVDDQKIRFDYTHNKALSAAELQQIEDLVNAQVSEGQTVECKIMSHKEALQMGAMALFGEKYGDQVRVLKMGDFSTELCGGTHVQNTAEIRVFKIVSESGVSSGVRRVEALTGDQALMYLLKNEEENQSARGLIGLDGNWQHYLDTNDKTKTVSAWVQSKKEEIKSLEREIKKLKGASVPIDDMIKSASKFKSTAGEYPLVMSKVDIEDRDLLAQVADQLKNKLGTGVVILLGKGDASHPLIVSVSKELNPKISAGNLLKEVALQLGGKGGGRPDFAQGAVPQLDPWDKAIEKAKSLLS
jgi:alanyl-tRNA synthetase